MENIGKSTEEKEEFTKGHIEKEELLGKSVEEFEEYPKNSRNLIIPVIILLASTIFFFWWTGKDKAQGSLAH